MRKLAYNVYSNISDKKFFEIAEKMSIWEHYMLGVLSPLKWRCTKKVTENDALIVDFTKYDDEFYENMGIVFEEEPGKIKFSFYLTKSFDEGGYRYFLRVYIFKNKEAESFENDIVELTKSTVERYNVLSKLDVINSGGKDTIG